MMIQSSNPISVLPGLENTGNAAQILPAAGSNTVAFTSSLLQQLAMLQDKLPNNVAVEPNVLPDLQANQSSNAANTVGQDVQNFAGLFGKASPTAKKTDPGINLDDTLNTLSDVLQYLQGLNADPAVPAQTQTAGDVAGQTQLIKDHTADSSSDADQVVDPSALMAAMSASLQQIQQLPQTQQQPLTPLPALKQSKDQAVSNQIPVLSDLYTNQDVSVLKNSSPNGNSGSRNETNSVVQNDNGKSANSDKQTLAFDANNAVTMGTASNQNNTAQNTGQEKQTATGNDGFNISVLADQSPSIDAGKNPTQIATDIANLNQAVSNGKTIQAPAMVKNIAHPEWNTELGQKLIWMHNQDIPSAELRLNPQHLGPITIKVDVDQGQTTVSFTAQHAEVKEAIEAAIPKLREMLGSQQLNLVDVNVSQQQSDQKPGNGFFQTAGGQGQSNKSRQSGQQVNSAIQPSLDIADEIESGRAIASNGLLSLFA